MQKSSVCCTFCKAAGTMRSRRSSTTGPAMTRGGLTTPRAAARHVPLEGCRGPRSNTFSAPAWSALSGYVCIPAGILTLRGVTGFPGQSRFQKETPCGWWLSDVLCTRPLFFQPGLILCSTLLSGFYFAHIKVVTLACLRNPRQWRWESFIAEKTAKNKNKFLWFVIIRCTRSYVLNRLYPLKSKLN